MDCLTIFHDLGGFASNLEIIHQIQIVSTVSGLGISRISYYDIGHAYTSLYHQTIPFT